MARLRAWIVTVLASVSLGLTVATVFVPDWIERLFDSAPDNGSGEVEAGIALAFLAVTVVLTVGALLAWRQVRRVRAVDPG